MEGVEAIEEQRLQLSVRRIHGRWCAYERLANGRGCAHSSGGDLLLLVIGGNQLSSGIDTSVGSPKLIGEPILWYL